MFTYHQADGENPRSRRAEYKSRERSLEVERAVEKEKGKTLRRLEGENFRLFKTRAENALGTT